MKSTTQIVRHLLRTEKGAVQSAQNKYFFAVEKGANKIEIRKAVETLYKVKVADVNTSLVPGKNKRVRYQLGRTPDWKKAVVTLQDGHKIDLA